MEVRGLTTRSERLANRSEGSWGRAGLGPVDKSKGLGRAQLAQGLSVDTSEVFGTA